MPANSKEYNLAYYYSDQRAIVECECGHNYMSYNKYRHIKTRIILKHIIWIGATIKLLQLKIFLWHQSLNLAKRQRTNPILYDV